MLLYGKPVIEKLFQETVTRVQTHTSHGAYVAFLLASDDYASSVYVAKKQDYAKRCGLWSELYHQPNASDKQILEKIQQRNEDALCLWIVVQLPLAKHLKSFQSQILYAVDPFKDVDGLWGKLFGLHLNQVVDFLPATPKATYALLDFYNLWDLQGKTVAMVGQSNLMGKPFVLEAMHRGATVLTTNSKTSSSLLKELVQKSDYIVTATGVVDLITPYLFDNQDITGKVIIDVWYGIKDGKACGDTDRSWLVDLWASITPVPGGVWPVTVACLFHNLIALHTIRKWW